MLKDRLAPSSFMAKGSSDVILRDRLQFDIDANGDTSLVYGRIDLSDYVSIVENKGLAIKEIRFMLRAPSVTVENGQWPMVMGKNVVDTVTETYVKLFATTTAYELVSDVGIASPNVLCVMDKQSYILNRGAPDSAFQYSWKDEWFGTPDLHPEGYDVVTDLLIGIAIQNANNPSLTETTCELDVMLIAEPKKITQRDLTQMLTQAQDL